MINSYKYDVAISFTQQDEHIAHKLNDLLSGRMNVFVYFARQTEIAGTNGEETFNKVYGQDARIVVVLYNPSWGSTPWTRIEETAIRNRAYNEGYNFVLMVPTGEGVSAPQWLPQTQLWIGLKRWGIDGAAAAIEARVQERGGQPKEESPIEYAQRIGRQREDDKTARAFIGSSEGVSKANECVKDIYERLQYIANQTKTSHCSVALQVKRVERDVFQIFSIGYHAYITWSLLYCNSLEESDLSVQYFFADRLKMIRGEKPTVLAEAKYRFAVRLPSTYGWHDTITEQFYSSDSLADTIVKELLNHIGK